MNKIIEANLFLAAGLMMVLSFCQGSQAVITFLIAVVFTPDCDTFIMVPECHNSFMVVSDTVGQYTGLKDKNGKRIFEGDICRNTRTGEIVSVKWHGTMAGYVWNKRRADGFLFDFGELFRACDKYEVIGTSPDKRGMPLSCMGMAARFATSMVTTNSAGSISPI